MIRKGIRFLIIERKRVSYWEIKGIGLLIMNRIGLLIMKGIEFLILKGIG